MKPDRKEIDIREYVSNESVLIVFRLLLFVCFLMVGFIPSRANLGETLDESIARYGKPETSPSSSGYNFSAGKEFFVSLYLVKGRVDYEVIGKQDGSIFTKSELNKLIQAESVGGKWSKPLVTESGRTFWQRDDGARAHYSVDEKGGMPNILCIGSKSFYSHPNCLGL